MERNTGKLKVFLGGLLAGLLLAAGALLFLAGGASGLRAAYKYSAVMRLIGTQFIGSYEPDDVTDAALSGAVDSLDDHWSYYMDAETYAAYQERSANLYQGIGVTVTKDEETGGFLIVTTNKNGPAQTAGLVPGDIILAVDGIDATEGDMIYLRSLIQADYGHDAVVTVLHEDGSVEDYSVSCEAVYSSPVLYEMLDGNVGYIAVYNFRQGAASDAIEAVDVLISEGAEALIFDVRSNPGGQVTELTELIDYLLPEGEIFISTDKRGRETVTCSDAECVALPMAVLINADSYSAAEYFAAALSEYGWAITVGESTTGKARSQVTLELPDKSALHISKYTYLTPMRVDLYEAGGLTPDIAVTLTEEETTLFETGWLVPEDDPQVLAALENLWVSKGNS